MGPLSLPRTIVRQVREMSKPNQVRTLSFQPLQDRQLLAADVAIQASDVQPAAVESTSSEQVSLDASAEVVSQPAYDVNADGSVSALDALMVINAMNQVDSMNGGEGEQASDDAVCDINQDGNVSAMDALMIINEMNRLEQERSGGTCSCGGVGCAACVETAASDEDALPAAPPNKFFIPETEETLFVWTGGCSCGGIGCAACT